MFATNKSSFAHSAFCLKVATVNLFNFVEPPSAFYSFDNIYTQHEWQKKLNWLNRYIGNYHPDVIAFQEVFSAKALRAQLEHLGYTFFAVIDEPTQTDEYIFRDPVVALASRYPILCAEPVLPDVSLAQKTGVTEEFSFSRTPLFATLELPALGETDFYVVHLKSKRPKEFALPSDNKQTLHDTMIDEMTGFWASAIQRGTEASQLMANVLRRRSHTNNPVVLLGDFNDELSSEVLHPFHLGGIRNITDDMADMPLSHYQLHDCWDLYVKTQDNIDFERPPTHYHGGRGSVLDYILLSNEFDHSDPERLVEVAEYHCEDKHLVNPHFDQDSHSSDHALVSVTLSLRR
ncbi:endonuclease/exonuclease/phosphatase family protein [Veronia pacifica]|uniref:Endonuclease/exonuclease/phosphatase n=1 Tax=Veronia pacifica TaxID=1080227 RepID=A0A1C3EML3_9GAMM|nr:endonuclease/exonuclease/phosphatase family protein [Veronia pacifica]ODA34478.1 endonuclease/exonuclease/phosphatase [Veronia pacifica]